MPTLRRSSLLTLFVCLLMPILLYRLCVAQKPPPGPSPEVFAILQKAMAAENISDFKEALKLYGQALEKAIGLKDQLGEAIALNNIGLAYYGLGQFQKAIRTAALIRRRLRMGLWMRGVRRWWRVYGRSRTLQRRR